MKAHPLEAFRLRERMTHEQMAKMLGVSRVTITRWLNGKRKPGEDKLPLIKKKTGIQPRELRPDLAAIFGAA